MKKPNTFIIGAPKCGTTSLANWLSEHPDTFICPTKEPNYFLFDIARPPLSLGAYEKLFRASEERHRVVFEASTSYLYSHVAVPAILSYANSPRFVVMTRDPVEMAPSLHQQRLFSGQEDEPDFERAWRLQADRLCGRHIPARCPDLQLLQYGWWCQLGEQLSRLHRWVSPDHIHIIPSESLHTSPRQEYLGLLRFLGLEDDGRKNFPKANSARQHTAPAIRNFVRSANTLARRIGLPYVRTGLTKKIDDRFSAPRARQRMTAALRGELEEYFATDKQLLQEVLDRRKENNRIIDTDARN